MKIDALVKSRKTPFPVIPAEAGIQSFQVIADHLDSGFHRSDDFQVTCHSRLDRESSILFISLWIPAFAGMTKVMRE